MSKATLKERYNIYCECLKQLGEKPLSFNDWLDH